MFFLIFINKYSVVLVQTVNYIGSSEILKIKFFINAFKKLEYYGIRSISNKCLSFISATENCFCTCFVATET